MAGGSLKLGAIVEAQSRWRSFELVLDPTCFHYLLFILFQVLQKPIDILLILAEGEAEIVAGFHVEYSGMGFAIFFLAEYINMALISVLDVNHVSWWLGKHFLPV